MASASESSVPAISVARSSRAPSSAADNNTNSCLADPRLRAFTTVVSSRSTSLPRASPGETGVPLKRSAVFFLLSTVRHTREVVFNQLDERTDCVLGVVPVGGKIQRGLTRYFHSHHARDAF